MKYFKHSILIAVMLAHSVIQSAAQTGAYTLNGGSATQTGQTYSASSTDESGVYVLNSGNLTLTNCSITTSGNSSNTGNSSQYGLNAGILAASSSKVTISGGSVTTSGSGANGIFATGPGTSISMSNGTIIATGDNAHGVDATYTGTIMLTNVDVSTSGSSSSALATDFGGGTVNVTGGTIISKSTASNSHSAGIYSTGIISVSSATVASLGDCGGVIDGANSILLTNTSLTGVVEGMKIHTTAPASGNAIVTISGGSLTSINGDGFYVTGESGNATNATLTVKDGAVVTAGTNNILHVLSSSSAALTVDNDSVAGNIVADNTSSVTMTLSTGSNLVGTINASNSAKSIALTIDAASSWIVTANSYVNSFSDASGISGTSINNITGNGFNIYYDATLSANSMLGGKTYSLVNGGVLAPKGSTAVDQQKSEQLTGYILNQNYPNPFNPTTIITFSLPEQSHIKLEVFNLLGEPVTTLVDERCSAGSHFITFNASGFSSGVYYYRMLADKFVSVRKLVIAK